MSVAEVGLASHLCPLPTQPSLSSLKGKVPCLVKDIASKALVADLVEERLSSRTIRLDTNTISILDGGIDKDLADGIAPPRRRDRATADPARTGTPRCARARG